MAFLNIQSFAFVFGNGHYDIGGPVMPTVTPTAKPLVTSRLSTIVQSVLENRKSKQSNIEIAAEPIHTSNSISSISFEAIRKAAQEKMNVEMAANPVYEELQKKEAQNREIEAKRKSLFLSQEIAFPKNLPADPHIQIIYRHLRDLLKGKEVVAVEKLITGSDIQTIVRFGETSRLTCVVSDDSLEFSIDRKPVRILIDKKIEPMRLRGSNNVIVFELKSEIYVFIDSDVNDFKANVWLLSDDPKKTRAYTVNELIS